MKNYISAVFGLICFGLISCDKEKTSESYQPVQEVIKPLGVQYPIDIAAIDKYLDEYYIENVSSELSISFNKIPSPNSEKKVSIRNQTIYPLMNKLVTIENIEHKIYYLSLRNGTQLPCTTQSNIVCGYKGLTLENKIFDVREDGIKLNLNQVIKGWQEIIPLFKSGNYSLNADGSVNSSTDFGAGVMFLPSALAYYNQERQPFITKYSPLIFTFKLRHVE